MTDFAWVMVAVTVAACWFAFGYAFGRRRGAPTIWVRIYLEGDFTEAKVREVFDERMAELARQVNQAAKRIAN